MCLDSHNYKNLFEDKKNNINLTIYLLVERDSALNWSTKSFQTGWKYQGINKYGGLTIDNLGT